MNPTTNLPTDRYARRGVSATKREIHAVVDRLDRGLFPGAFCKIGPDRLTGDPEKCNVIHSDGAGTKSVLAYLCYRETGDAKWFRGTAQDSLVMNIDDLLCIGAVDGILISGTINRNARNVPGEALSELILGTETFLETMRRHGVGIYGGGGETADVGDLTGTVTVDSCAVATMNRKDVIDNARIVPGLAIVGLASSGRAIYETFENSGIGSNGLTSARHDLLCKYYLEKYPETCDRKTEADLLYCGPYKMEDALPDSEWTVGEALMSPTRTYAPVIRRLLEEDRDAIRGIVHCSGGGQTKCLRFGTGVHIVKDDLLPVPPVFKAIRETSGTPEKEMFRVYNMGHRMEIYCPPEKAETISETIRSFGIAAQIIGRTEPSQRPDRANHLTIEHEGNRLLYAIER